ncbi:hypothetical protein [Streptomyces sp. NPDC059863]|uniref:hypothetical protein n=1 Tax=unclassified Streptomyces TaxID=2593676 RepID=UPI00365F5ECD
MLMSLSGLGWGEVAEDLVLAQTAAVVEGLDEGKDLGESGGPGQAMSGFRSLL